MLLSLYHRVERIAFPVAGQGSQFVHPLVKVFIRLYPQRGQKRMRGLAAMAGHIAVGHLCTGQGAGCPPEGNGPQNNNRVHLLSRLHDSVSRCPFYTRGGHGEEAKRDRREKKSGCCVVCQEMSIFCPSEPLGWYAGLFIV